MSEENKKSGLNKQTLLIAIALPLIIVLGTILNNTALSLVWRVIIILFGGAALVFAVAGILALAGKRK